LSLAAYLSAHVHMFLLPGQATLQAMIDLLASNLNAICTISTQLHTAIWKVLPSGLTPLRPSRS
jgi:hypothetical protein